MSPEPLHSRTQAPAVKRVKRLWRREWSLTGSKKLELLNFGPTCESKWVYHLRDSGLASLSAAKSNAGLFYGLLLCPEIHGIFSTHVFQTPSGRCVLHACGLNIVERPITHSEATLYYYAKELFQRFSRVYNLFLSLF